MGSVTHTSSMEECVVILLKLEKAAVGKSISMECFMQIELLVVFSEMKCKKNACLFNSFLRSVCLL